MYVNFTGANDRELIGEVIMTKGRLKKLAKRMMKIDEFAYDTETNTLRVQHEGEMDLVGISICFGEQDAYYIPTGHFFDEGQLDADTVVKYLKPVFERKDVRIIGHNLKFDLHVLQNVGITVQTDDIFDIMIARWITDENMEKGLKGMTSQLYAVKQTKFDECLSTVTTDEKKAYGLKGNNKASFVLVRVPIGAPYAIADAYWTWRHYCDWQLDEVKNEEMETIFYKVQMPFLKTLYNMERRGMRIDVDRLKEMQKKAESDLEELHYQMIEIAGVEFNPASSQQLGELLFGYKKVNKKGEFTGNIELLDNGFDFPVISLTAGGAPQTGDKQLRALSKMNYKRDKRKIEGVGLVKLLLKYKKLNKLKSAFIDGLITQAYSDGKVHPSFNQVGTDSGRLSCSEPNLQQLPRPIEMPVEPKIEWFDGDEKAYKVAMDKYLVDKEEADFWKFYEIRDVFIPDDRDNEVVIALDYSNLEMRLLAHFSQDPYLMETFVQDHDAHGSTAVNMFQLDCEADKAKKKYPTLRQIAKTINFLLMYGGGAFTLYNTLSDQEAVDENGDPVTKEKAQEYYDKYFETYAGVAEFIKNQKKFAHRHGMVFSLIGRKRRLPDINSNDYKLVGYQERLSVNSCIQGSGGDIMMMCQPKIDNNKRLKELGCTMRLQVHDELVFVCPEKNAEEAITIIKDLMENPLPKPLNIPLRVDSDTGKSYAEAK